MTQKTAESWLKCTRRVEGARLRLYGFPFAAGGASTYRTWWELAPADVEIVAVQPPGREERLTERPYASRASLVRAVADVLVPSLTLPYAFFGHSMGALVAFDLARELRRRGAPLPVHLFVSSRRAPHLPYERTLHGLPDAQLVAELRRMGGTPEELLANKEILDLFLPLFRADLAVNEAEPLVPAEPLACPITAYAADGDERATPAEVLGWGAHTTGAFTREVFAGNHFYLVPQRAALLASIGRALTGG